MADYNTLPGCIGYYGTPREPNLCNTCAFREVCRKISVEFLPKAKLNSIIKRLENILMAMEARA